MTIEESIKNDPSKFEAILDAKVPELKAAVQALSANFDTILKGAMKEYCEAEGAELDINAIPEYKTMNRMISGKLDIIIGEQIKEKRKNL